jgi:hypothetical protein
MTTTREIPIIDTIRFFTQPNRCIDCDTKNDDTDWFIDFIGQPGVMHASCFCKKIGINMRSTGMTAELIDYLYAQYGMVSAPAEAEAQTQVANAVIMQDDELTKAIRLVIENGLQVTQPYAGVTQQDGVNFVRDHRGYTLQCDEASGRLRGRDWTVHKVVTK